MLEGVKMQHLFMNHLCFVTDLNYLFEQLPLEWSCYAAQMEEGIVELNGAV